MRANQFEFLCMCIKLYIMNRSFLFRFDAWISVFREAVHEGRASPSVRHRHLTARGFLIVSLSLPLHSKCQRQTQIIRASGLRRLRDYTLAGGATNNEQLNRKTSKKLTKGDAGVPANKAAAAAAAAISIACHILCVLWHPQGCLTTLTQLGSINYKKNQACGCVCVRVYVCMMNASTRTHTQCERETESEADRQSTHLNSYTNTDCGMNNWMALQCCLLVSQIVKQAKSKTYAVFSEQ